MILGLLTAAALAAAAADIDRLAFMAGSWDVARNGGHVREVWMAPVDGAMAGATLTTRPGKAAMVEFAKITAEPAGLTYTAVVAGQPPTPFLLKSLADGEAVFENLAHDFPQRVIYRRCGADLCARIEGTVGGAMKTHDWRYVRVAP